MSLTVKLSDDELAKKQDSASEESEQRVQKTPNGKLGAKLNVRRTIDGNYYIYDHRYIDIILMPEKSKILTLPYSEKGKISFSDLVYATQDNFFDYLTRKGIIAPQTIKGGNVFGSMEAQILKPKDTGIPLDQLVLLNIASWIDDQKASLEFDKKYEEEFDKYLTEPDEEESTELGEVPQKSEKGSIPKYQSRRYLGGWW